jgi:methionine sulfoxide reductase heme-binding subunit
MPIKGTLRFLIEFQAVLRKKQTQIDPLSFGITSPVIAAIVTWLSNLWNFCLVLSLLPGLYLWVLIQFDALGPNPVEAFHLFTGIWSLRFLCLTLLITPLQVVTSWRGVAPFRQLLGLTSFFYAALHVWGYLSIDHALIWPTIGQDLLETPYLWPGLLAFLILLLLALSSPKQGKKLLGKNWKKLHRWIYVAAVASILHYVMQLKGNLADPLFYGLIIGLLFASRIVIWIRNRQVTRLMIPRPRRLGDDDEEASGLTHRQGRGSAAGASKTTGILNSRS